MAFDGIASLANSVLGFFFDSPEVKAVKESGRVELAKLELEIKKETRAAAAKAEADYDTQAMKNMQTSYKDEFLIILHTLPVYGYVIPSETLHNSLDKLWVHIESAPYWWTLSYFGILASTFGLRWLFSNKVDKMMGRKK